MCSHIRYWGSTNINYRREDLLTFNVPMNIEVCNTDNQPTFVVANRSEVLYITLFFPLIYSVELKVEGIRQRYVIRSQTDKF